LTPYAKNRNSYNRKHKNDSTNVDRLFIEAEDRPYRTTTHTPHNKSVDYSHGHFKGLGNLKNEDQLEEVFAPEYLKGNEEIKYISINQ
jgi:hypothetical protein